ncbi:MAG: isoprenyl transferase [Ignavibacteriaceae bacterium]|nr:MAG: isoprenyl transferase [Ignavibacteriaceae bacterium]
MDGNGRWAKSNNLPRIAGHREGVESVREIVKSCARIGVKYLTLYTFSTENWKRPKTEVTTLMRLLVKVLRREIQELHNNDVKLQAIGDICALPKDVQKELADAIDKTKNNKTLTLVLALSYSGRWEIVDAVRLIAQDLKEGKITEEEIQIDTFSRYLNTRNIPDPDLLIRTSGEMRISNFLLWQLAYSEMYITPVFWPQFREKQLLDAIADYGKRERRFGKVSEQLHNQG